jgi:polar amino acid transport system substrate-binding protein
VLEGFDASSSAASAQAFWDRRHCKNTAFAGGLDFMTDASNSLYCVLMRSEILAIYRRTLAIAVVAALAATLSVPAVAQTASLDDALQAADLAPTGTLRVAFLATNPIQGRIDAETGEVSGPIADIVAELAARIGVPVRYLPQNGAQNVMDRVSRGEADLGFLAYADSRAEQVDYAAPYATMMSSYLVAANSPFATSADVDAEGNVIGTVIGRAQELYLSANIRHAELELYEVQPPDREIERLLVSGELSAIGQNRQRSVDHAGRFPSLRVLDDSFLSIPQAFVIRKGQTNKARALTRFMDELRDSGFVQASLEKADLLSAASVAPPGIP